MKRIMIVDDDPGVRGVVGRYLLRCGHAATQFAAAEPALAAFESGAYDLVITDLELPGRSGAWLMQMLRRHEPDVPIILMSGSPLVRNAGELFVDADALVQKPFDLAELGGIVHRLL